MSKSSHYKYYKWGDFLKEKIYDKQKAIEYARKWAYGRNPAYYNFDPVGGDCTSFVSQCIYEGSKIMNYDKYGWYYKNGNNKSPSWSGVEYLYKFLIQNKGVGPYGEEAIAKFIEDGDIAQLSFDGKNFAHSLLIVKKDKNYYTNNILIATHTQDAWERNIGSYNYKKIRFIHIRGIRY